jgi:hypothetical protein
MELEQLVVMRDTLRAARYNPSFGFAGFCTEGKIILLVNGVKV